MKPKLITQLKETLIIPIGIFATLVVYSMTLGWNLLTALLFWFILIPVLAYYLPNLISKNKFHPKQNVTGLLIFYSFMVFMIYKHYQTDLFQLMMISLISNVLLVFFITWMKKQEEQLKQ